MKKWLKRKKKIQKKEAIMKGLDMQIIAVYSFLFLLGRKKRKEGKKKLADTIKKLRLNS